MRAHKYRYRSLHGNYPHQPENGHYARMADEALSPNRSDVVVDFDKEDDFLTLTGEAFVLQVRASAEDLACSGEEPDTVLVLVGHDDETWDLALVIPVATVETIVRRAAETQSA